MLGKNIKKLREKRGLSQDKLTKRADITLTTLVKLETGINDNPTLKTLVKLANALEISIDELVKNS